MSGKTRELRSAVASCRTIQCGSTGKGSERVGSQLNRVQVSTPADVPKYHHDATNKMARMQSHVRCASIRRWRGTLKPGGLPVRQTLIVPDGPGLAHRRRRSKHPIGGTVVEREGDGVQVIGAHGAQIGPLRKVLPKQAIGILVRAALSRTLWVAEIDQRAGVESATAGTTQWWRVSSRR